FHGRTEKEVEMATSEIVRKKSLHHVSYRVKQAELARFMESNELIELQLLKDKENAQARLTVSHDGPSAEDENAEHVEYELDRGQTEIKPRSIIDLNVSIPDDF